MKDVLEAVKPLSTHRIARKHSVVIYQGEVPRSVTFVRKGIVKAYTLTSNGNEQVVAYFTEGEPLVLTWVFNKTTSSLYYYEAVDDCELYTLPKDSFLELLKNKPTLKEELFQYFLTLNTGLLLRITALEQQRAVEKLVFTLYFLAFRYGELDDKGSHHIRLSLTHNSIASLVGLTRETTATELAKLKRKGIIDYSAEEYVVDKSKLERVMGEDAFTNLKLN